MTANPRIVFGRQLPVFGNCKSIVTASTVTYYVADPSCGHGCAVRGRAGERQQDAFNTIRTGCCATSSRSKNQGAGTAIRQLAACALIKWKEKRAGVPAAQA
jgi:hypothetical protein